MFLQYSMNKVQVSNFENQTKNQQQVIEEVIKDMFQDISRRIIQNNSENPRQRSGSQPSKKKTKQSDLQSVSTMTGTFPSHNSDKRIQQIASKRVQIKVPQSKKDPQNIDISKQPVWTFDKNGYMCSSAEDMTNIKYYFIRTASKFGMVIMRDLEDIITVKTQRIDSMRCLFMMCLPLTSDRSVYQLERYKSNKDIKIKLKLISGIQEKFYQFTKSFYYQLWSKNVLKLSNFQALNLMCFTNKNIISQSIINYEQACSQFQIKNLGTEQQIEGWQTQLMRRFKKSEQNMKQKIYTQDINISRICKNNINQIMIQKIIMQQIPISDFYLKIQINDNKELLEKKSKILNSYSISKLFEYLQISSKLLKNKYLQDKKPIAQTLAQNLPFAQAISFIDELSLTASPLQNIGKITNFGDKLNQCFEVEDGRPDAVMDMDSQLPLTIYCSLLSKNNQLKPTVSFLCDYFESEDEYQSQNRTLAALKAALEYVRQQWKIVEQKL